MTDNIKLIQSRLRTRKYSVSRALIRQHLTVEGWQDNETLTEEQITKIMNQFIKQEEPTDSSSLVTLTEEDKASVKQLVTLTEEDKASVKQLVTLTEEDKASVKQLVTLTEEDKASVKQLVTLTEEDELQIQVSLTQDEEEVFMQQIEPRPVDPKVQQAGGIQLTGQGKLDFIEETANKAGLTLAKAEIAEIAKSAPSSFQTRRQMISCVLASIEKYLSDEEEFFASKLDSISNRVTNADRKVATKVNILLGGVEDSAQAFKSLADELEKEFSELNGGDK